MKTIPVDFSIKSW